MYKCIVHHISAALRLQGIAAIFHDETLVVLARDALASAPGDPAPVRRIGAHLDEIGGQIAV